MNEIINTILNWPVIVQGALGSALFWIILAGGQKLYGISVKLISGISTNAKLNSLNIQLVKYNAMAAEDKAEEASLVSGLIYRCLREVIKGLLWLSLGLIFQTIIPVLGVVGYLGCIYFLFRALSFVQAIDTKIDAKQKVVEILKEIHEIEKT